MEAKHKIVRFAAFEADLHTEELRKHGRRLRIPRQSFRILALLLERPGELVRREELRENLWTADTFVDFDHGLNAAMNRLRDALGDSADLPRYIETLPGRGYRFIGVPASITEKTISEIDASPPPALYDEGLRTTSSTQQTHRARRKVLLAVSIVLAIGAILAGRAYLKPRTISKPGAIRSIAVLPLDNLSAEPEQEYFADGMTDAIITDLARITTIRVISRTSVMRYRHTNKSLGEIARELNVDAVVEGTVMRSGNRVRITAQLIRSSNDQHLWADQFEGDVRDVLALQADVARAISTKIELKLVGSEQPVWAASRHPDSAAYDDFLRGRYIFQQRGTKQSLEKAIGYFTRAVQLDQNYAPAYAALADCYTFGFAFMGRPVSTQDAWAQASQAAKKSLQLNPDLAEGHIALATILFRYNWDWAGAEREYQRAIELDSNDAYAYQSYAVFLNLMKRSDEAMAAIKRAEQLDPLSPSVSSVKGYTYTWQHRFDDAIQQEHKTLELDPDYIQAHTDLAWCYEQKEMWDEAVAEWINVFALEGMKPTMIEALRQSYAQGGIRRFRRTWLALLQRQWMRGERPKYMQMARLAFLLGDRSAGFGWLEHAYTEHDPGLPNVYYAAIWLDRFRSDPRYLDLVQRMDFPK
jgi:TolB-like protein/DNA-binding winged helix-turn-helix (wHTH) protein/Flp pilus assembly protein TadD